ncbi:MAG: integration host factor subunit beta [Fibrobacteria bacterium]|nr:integration host factor subunit beta [Fibrobacteria bacterium]
MPNVTKQDLVQQASVLNGRTQSETRAVFESFLQLVGEHLQAGQAIEIRGFGTFHSRKRLPRPARNPRTGEVVPLGERNVALFKFSSDLRLDTSAPQWTAEEALA